MIGSAADRIDAAISAVVAFQGVKFMNIEAKPKPKVEWINL